MGTINTSMHAVQQAQDDLSELDSLPPLGQDMVNIVHGFLFLFLNPHLRIYSLIPEREKHRSVAFHMCPKCGPNHDLDMCPDWGLNPRPFSLWDNTPAN